MDNDRLIIGNGNARIRPLPRAYRSVIAAMMLIRRKTANAISPAHAASVTDVATAAPSAPNGGINTASWTMFPKAQMNMILAESF